MGRGDQCTVCEGAVNIISIFDLYYEYMVINLKLTPGTIILQVQLCWGTPKALGKANRTGSWAMDRTNNSKLSVGSTVYGMTTGRTSISNPKLSSLQSMLMARTITVCIISQP